MNRPYICYCYYKILLLITLPVVLIIAVLIIAVIIDSGIFCDVAHFCLIYKHPFVQFYLSVFSALFINNWGTLACISPHIYAPVKQDLLHNCLRVGTQVTWKITLIEISLNTFHSLEFPGMSVKWCISFSLKQTCTHARTHTVKKSYFNNF